MRLSWQRRGWALSAWLRATHLYLLLAPRRVVLAGLGCMALAASSDIANTFDSPRRGGAGPAVALFITLALAFACFLAAARHPLPLLLRRHRRLTRLLIYPVLLWSVFTAYQTCGIVLQGSVEALTTRHVQYGSDDLYDNHFNALLVLHGRNPYTNADLAAEARYFGERAFTPIRRGRFSDPRRYPTQAEMDAVMDAYLAHPESPPPELDPRTLHSYPAGAFLVDVPLVWAGLPSVAIAQIALFVLLVAAICAASPPAWRPLVALLALATADGARQATGGDFEIWPLAFVMGAWLLRERRIGSAVLLGAACAIKQTAWLAAPFYLIWVWREHGRAEALKRTVLAVGTFLAINGPWIALSPRAWLESLLLPVSLPLLPDGSGIIALSLTGVLPLLPPLIYSLQELAALAGALVWYWRRLPRYPYAGLVLPLLPLLLAWRSSERYFVLLPLAALLAVALTLRVGRGVASYRGGGDAPEKIIHAPERIMPKT